MLRLILTSCAGAALVLFPAFLGGCSHHAEHHALNVKHHHSRGSGHHADHQRYGGAHEIDDHADDTHSH